MRELPRHNPTLPRHSFNSPKRNGATPPDARLSIIAEDGDLPPRPPANTHHRPFSRRWNLGDPPRPSFETSPPKYALWDVTGPKGEKLADVRNNKFIARRGGWRRTCLIALILAAAVVALVVGLVVGLRNRSHKSSSTSSPAPLDTPPSSSPLSSGPFPVGVYSFETFLANVTTSCASKASDWQCAPYHTYTESSSEAMFTFQWIIADPDNDSSDFTISSPPNPFAISFANASLRLVDAGQDMERYTYNTSFDKMVITSLGVHCYFNNTLFEASLYTKRPKSYPLKASESSSPAATEPASAASASPVPYADWPYAVDIKLSLGGGPTVPECYEMNNGVKGARVIDGRIPKTSQDICSCIYRNHDP